MDKFLEIYDAWSQNFPLPTIIIYTIVVNFWITNCHKLEISHFLGFWVGMAALAGLGNLVKIHSNGLMPVIINKWKRIAFLVGSCLLTSLQFITWTLLQGYPFTCLQGSNYALSLIAFLVANLLIVFYTWALLNLKILLSGHVIINNPETTPLLRAPSPAGVREEE